VALALAARQAGPFAGDGRAALGKVLDVMDPDSRRRAEALAARLWIRDDDRPQAGAALRAVETALASRVVVALDYRDAAGRRTRRRVEPHLLAHTRGSWYLIGWCRERDGVRWFRWDRVEAAHVTTEPVADRDPGEFGVPPPGAHPVGLPGPADRPELAVSGSSVLDQAADRDRSDMAGGRDGLGQGEADVDQRRPAQVGDVGDRRPDRLGDFSVRLRP
jgi:WYL domain